MFLFGCTIFLDMVISAVGGGNGLIDAIRRLLAIGMLIMAALGLLPLVPVVFGFRSAAVTSGVGGMPAGTGTYHPSTSDPPFVSCVQAPIANDLVTGELYQDFKFFQCTNNWSSDIQISSISSNMNGLTLSGFPITVPAGGVPLCVALDVQGTKKVNNLTEVVYTAQLLSTTGDLSGTIQFAGQVRVNNKAPTPCQ